MSKSYLNQCVDDYELKYVDFVRSLPEQRIDDFKHYLSLKKVFNSLRVSKKKFMIILTS